MVSLNHKDGSHPGQPKTIVTNVKIAAVASLTKQDGYLTLKNIAHSIAILLGSAPKILTQQLKLKKVCTWPPPVA